MQNTSAAMVAIETKAAMAPVTVLIFDFDMTIIDVDSDDWVVDALGATSTLNNHLAASLPCISAMDEIMKTLHGQGKTIDDIGKCLRSIPIHFSIIQVIKFAHSLGCELRIVSDANLFFIETVLRHHGIFHCFAEINTNPSYMDNDGRLRIFPYHDFLSEPHGCGSRCPPNMCKGSVLERIKASLLEQGRSKMRFVYLGYGIGDFCPATKLTEEDYLMPRENFPLWYLISKEGDYQHLIKTKIYGWKDGEELGRVLTSIINSILGQDDEEMSKAMIMPENKCELEIAVATNSCTRRILTPKALLPVLHQLT